MRRGLSVAVVRSHMPSPLEGCAVDASLITDGPRFFPNVLRSRQFIDAGVLFGAEGLADGAIENLHWAVVDPRKHIMYIWEKQQDDFVEAARDLSATVVTNGSFNIYSAGGKDRAVLKGATAVVGEYLFTFTELPGWVWSRFDEQLAQQIARRFEVRLERALMRAFSSSVPEGFIYGTNEGIAETTESRPQQHYFGRRGGRNFENYEIGNGDPPISDEAIGGLFRAVDAYRSADPLPDQVVGFGLWGIAPLTNDPALAEAGVIEALEELAEREPGHEELGELTGVLITAFWWGRVATVIDLFVAARVKEAVRIDGNSSILLGRGAEILVNENMITPKRYYNKWGYQFQPG